MPPDRTQVPPGLSYSRDHRAEHTHPLILPLRRISTSAWNPPDFRWHLPSGKIPCPSARTRSALPRHPAQYRTCSFWAGKNYRRRSPAFPPPTPLPKRFLSPAQFCRIPLLHSRRYCPLSARQAFRFPSLSPFLFPFRVPSPASLLFLL